MVFPMYFVKMCLALKTLDNMEKWVFICFLHLSGLADFFQCFFFFFYANVLLRQTLDNMKKWVFMGILQMKRVKGENRFVQGFFSK